MRPSFAMLVLLAAACGGSQPPAESDPDLAVAASEETTPGAAHPRIEPPPGWVLETKDDAVIASTTTSPAVIALGTAPLAATVDDIEAEAGRLAEAVGVTVSEGIALKALAERATRMGDRNLALWEIADAERAGARGAVLVFAGKLTGEALVVGIGFAVIDDLATSDAILEALATIAPPGPSRSDSESAPP